MARSVPVLFCKAKVRKRVLPKQICTSTMPAYVLQKPPHRHPPTKETRHECPHFPKLAPTVKLLINGQLVESKTTQWRNVVNPATQEVLARVPFATPEEINLAVSNAKEAFKTWKKTPSAPAPAFS